MGLPPVRVSTAQLGADSFVVTVSGELDLHSIEQLVGELDRTLEFGARRLIVDLVGVSFLDSAALGALTRTARELRENGGDCIIVSDDFRVLKVFQITGLDRIFQIERSLAEAVEGLVALGRR